MSSFLNNILAIALRDLTTDHSPMEGEFDFLKGQIPTNSPSKPGRVVVGLNIDKHISYRLCHTPFTNLIMSHMNMNLFLVHVNK